MRNLGNVLLLALLPAGIAQAGGAPLTITFDDRVLFLNGWVDGSFGFDEYFGDAFASQTGQFILPGFVASVGDARFGNQASFADSFASQNSLVQFNADHTVAMTTE